MDNIKISLDAVKTEIENYAKEIISKGKVAFDESRFEDATRLSLQGEKLKDFNNKIDKLASEWDRNFTTVIKKHFPKKITSSPKSQRTGLSVKFQDGTAFCERKAHETFSSSLSKIGFERIKDLNINVRGLPLVSRVKNNHPDYKEHLFNGYWVITHSSTLEKKRTLEFISKKLNLNLEVEIINKLSPSD